MTTEQFLNTKGWRILTPNCYQKGIVVMSTQDALLEEAEKLDGLVRRWEPFMRRAAKCAFCDGNDKAQNAILDYDAEKVGAEKAAEAKG